MKTLVTTVTLKVLPPKITKQMSLKIFLKKQRNSKVNPLNLFMKLSYNL